MNPRRKRAGLIALVVCLLAAGGYLAYRFTVKDYVDCCRALMRVYNAEASDLSFTVGVNTSGVDLDANFRAVKFPFQDGSAVQVTVYGKSGDAVFYKINGQSVAADGETDVGESGIPQNFMGLLQWGAEVYKSGLELRTTRDGRRVTYRADVPDELVQSFLDSYLGSLEQLELRYSDCELTAVTAGGVLTELSLQGTATYKVLFVNASSAVNIRARVNAVGDDVTIPDVPDTVVKSA